MEAQHGKQIPQMLCLFSGRQGKKITLISFLVVQKTSRLFEQSACHAVLSRNVGNLPKQEAKL